MKDFTVVGYDYGTGIYDTVTSYRSTPHTLTILMPNTTYSMWRLSTSGSTHLTCCVYDKNGNYLVRYEKINATLNDVLTFTTHKNTYYCSFACGIDAINHIMLIKSNTKNNDAYRQQYISNDNSKNIFIENLLQYTTFKQYINSAYLAQNPNITSIYDLKAGFYILDTRTSSSTKVTEATLSGLPSYEWWSILIKIPSMEDDNFWVNIFMQFEVAFNDINNNNLWHFRTIYISPQNHGPQKWINILNKNSNQTYFIPERIKYRVGTIQDINFNRLTNGDGTDIYLKQAYDYLTPYKDFVRIHDATSSFNFDIVTHDGIKKIYVDATTLNYNTKNVMVIGDSWTDSSGKFMEYMKEMDSNIFFKGTRTSSYGNIPCEGYGGKHAEWFVTNSESPFVFNGTLSFSTYMASHTDYNLTHVIILLGANLCGSYRTSTQALINSIKAYDSNIKVIVGNSGPCSRYPAMGKGGGSHPNNLENQFLDRIKEFYDLIKLTNVDEIAYLHMCMHDIYSFSYTKLKYSEDIDEDIIYVNEYLHPTVKGHKQLAQALISYIN